MRTFRLRVAYDGTEFHGWQSQAGLRTVQGTLEEALKTVTRDQQIAVAAAGRTDAGVHARGQVASFQADTSLPARALPPLLNRALPGDVRVRDAAEAAPEFNARRSARARRYVYSLLESDDVLWGRFAWSPPGPLALDALERATHALEGESDFVAFQAAGGTATRTVCRVMRAGIRMWGPIAQLEIVADHFLYHMVRGIVGTALALSRTRDPGAAMREVVSSGDRRRTGPTAPAKGLSLEAVYYAPEESFA
jgi:tRNA pseudouridine38-40 synthase